MSDVHGFGPRLRQERERRKISLTTIAETTKIGVPLLEGLERDDLARWPSGIFRRSFVRAYAQAIGLDPDLTVREFLERFPDPDEPLVAPDVPVVEAPAEPLHARILPSGATARAARVIDHARAMAGRLRSGPAFRVRVVDAANAFRRGELLVDARRRWAAVACDVGVLLAVALVVFIVIGRFWEALGVLAFGYYGGGILFLGNTPGVCLFAPDTTDRR